MPVNVGSSAEVELIVSDEDSAVHFGTGEVAVLATPRLIALCEQAALKAILNQLNPGQTSVSMQVRIDHLAPTAVGSRVHAEATVDEVKGRRITFKVSARDDRGLIAAGFVTRVAVDREHFLDKCR